MAQLILAISPSQPDSAATRDAVVSHLEPFLAAVDTTLHAKGLGHAGEPVEGRAWVSFKTSDLLVAEYVAIDKTFGTPLEDSFDVLKELPTAEISYRSIEIYFNQSDIPNGYDPLDFRNQAMELVETAMAKADAGEWSGADIGANLETGEPEVNFGFEVNDFGQAEALVREALRGTPFDCIREITRFAT